MNFNCQIFKKWRSILHEKKKSTRFGDGGGAFGVVGGSPPRILY